MNHVVVQCKHNFHKPQNLLFSGVLTDFSILLKTLIFQRYSSIREFVRHTRTNNEDSGTAYVSKVVTGKNSPPMARLPAWADALELYGDERQCFMDLAAIAHLPVEAWPRFTMLLRQEQSAKAAALRAQDLTLRIQDLTLRVQGLTLENQQLLDLLEAGRHGPSKSK